MRRALPIFAAFFMILAAPVLAADETKPLMPGLNTDMGDMDAGPGTALPPPGMEDGKVKRPKPGEAADIPPSEMYPDVPPAPRDPLAPQGVLPPSVDANATPKPADVNAPPAPVLPGDPTEPKPLPPVAE